MSDFILSVNTHREMEDRLGRLRQVVMRSTLSPRAVLEIFEHWAVALQANQTNDIPGLAFLRLWLRRGTLEPILARELGWNAMDGDWQVDGRARLRAFPLGVIGHWPAGNIEIQPLLSLSCALLGGNACVVRVPSRLVAVTGRLMQKLAAADPAGILAERVALVSFEHSRRDLHEAMARAVDGAMIWGSATAVTAVRTLPFPHWARIMVFGPRISVAAMDAETWNNPAERVSWSRRIARDVWQFDQQACSSPQVLFLERDARADPGEFVAELAYALREENRIHPRQVAAPALVSAICLARASWLLADTGHKAWFPASPDWTVLLGSGSDIPTPTQGRTLSVLVADDLREVILKFDGTVQTLGLAIHNPQKETNLVQIAGLRGVDRIVKLGRMHVFNSPWDGVDLVRSMVRLVRHVPSQLGTD